MSEHIVSVQHLSCKVGNRYLLKDINWQIKRGDNWILFGLNGCGKTTLLSVIAGYKASLQGEVAVFGEHYTEENWQALRRRIAWISSSFFDRYYTSESVLQIVLSGKFATFGLGQGVTDGDVIRAQAILAELHMQAFIDRPYYMLSKGERQNVLIARALMNDAELFLLDEPCSGLDVAARDRMIWYVRKLAQREDITLVYVTHYAEEIPEEFEHVLFMSQGRVYAKGSARELLSSQKLSTFLGENVESTWMEGRLHLKFTGERRVKEHDYQFYA